MILLRYCYDNCDIITMFFATSVMHYHCEAQVSAKTWDAKFRYWSESMKLKETFRQNGNEKLLKTTERSLFWYH